MISSITKIDRGIRGGKGCVSGVGSRRELHIHRIQVEVPAVVVVLVDDKLLQLGVLNFKGVAAAVV